MDIRIHILGNDKHVVVSLRGADAVLDSIPGLKTLVSSIYGACKDTDVVDIDATNIGRFVPAVQTSAPASAAQPIVQPAVSTPSGQTASPLPANFAPVQTSAQGNPA